MERKIHFREKRLIFLGIFGEAELILTFGEQRKNTFRGAEEFFFQGFGEIDALISVIKGAHTHPGGAHRLSIFLFCNNANLLCIA